MTRLTGNWFLDTRHILHACAPGLRVLWRGTPTCECGVAVPRRVTRFHEWLTAGDPAGGRRASARLDLVVFHVPTRRGPA